VQVSAVAAYFAAFAVVAACIGSAPLIGPLLVVVVAASFLLPTVAGRGCCGQCVRKNWLLRAYLGWACLENFVSAVMGVGLHWAGSNILTDLDGNLDQEWQWFWVLVVITNMLCWAAVFSQVLVVVLVRRRWRGLALFASHNGERSAVPHPSEIDLASLDPEAAAKGGNAVVEATGMPAIGEADVASATASFPDSSSSCAASTASTFDSPTRGAESRGSPQLMAKLAAVSFVLCAYIAVVAIPAGASFRYSFGSPLGWTLGHDLPTESCTSYYCRPHSSVEELHVVSDLVYGQAVNHSGETELLKLDVYSLNASSRRAGLAPAIVLMHGGAFAFGSRFQKLPWEEAKALAQHGFVVFTIDYRRESQSGLPEIGAVNAAIEDVKAAVRYVVRHAEEFGVDPGRIATWGTSAGAIASGSMDFVEDPGESGNPGFPSNVSAHVLLSGCMWPLVLRPNRRPKAPAPWLDVHGTNDGIVFPVLSVVTHLYLRTLGMPAEQNRLIWVPGGHHEPWRKKLPGQEHPPRDALRQHVLAFLVRELRLEDGPDLS